MVGFYNWRKQYYFYLAAYNQQSPAGYDNMKSPRLPPGSGPYDPYGLGTKSPRYPDTPRSGRSTPRTINSPRSMIESSIGDATPLYDEN